MRNSRRDFLKMAGIACLRCPYLCVGSAALTSCQSQKSAIEEDPFAGLISMTDDIKPITREDYENRHNRARALMKEEGIDALYLSGSRNLYYFSGINMGSGDRLFAMLLPRDGAPAFVCANFEVDRAKERVKYGEEDIRPWHEHEDPFQLFAETMKEKGIEKGVIGVDEKLPFWYYKKLEQAAPQAKYRPADPVTHELRAIKSEKEIALTRRAVEVTMEAYRATFRTIHQGMTKAELRQNFVRAFSALGARGGAGASFGSASGNPHGSKVEPLLEEGTVVLVDGGCRLDNYPSDISRTITCGKAPEKVVQVFEIVRQAQLAGIRAIRPGVPCEEADRAARQVVDEAGYGPAYTYFSHRLGHGLGLDGHDGPYHLVKGNKTPMRVGMMFTVEPGIYIPGEFGVRIEDDIVVTEDGCEVFAKEFMSLSIDNPFGE
ncbi:M24 family metallopeptidase [Acidobacteriota bacterium]